MPYNTGVHDLRICSIKMLPWLDWDENGKLSGVVSYMLDDFTKALNFTYRFVAKSGYWGKKLEDGSWNGFYGMFMRNESDLILMATTANALRLEPAHFTIAYHTSLLNIVSGAKGEVPKQLFGILMTFDMDVWAAIFSAMILLSVVSAVADKVLQTLDGIGPKVNLGYDILDKIIGMFAALFLEATPRDPHRDVPRFALMLWCISVLTLMNAFMGQFKSSLMVIVEPPRIDSVHDLAKLDQKRILVFKDSAFEDLIRRSKMDAMVKLTKLIEDAKGFVPVLTVYSRDTLEEVLMGKSIIISESVSVSYYLGKRCAEPGGAKFYIGKEPLIPSNMHLTMNKRLPQAFKDAIDDRIYRFSESGIMSVWLGNMLRDWDKCVAPDLERGESTMGFSEFYGIFILWFMGLVLSTIALIGELIKFRLDNRRAKRASKAQQKIF